MKEQVLEKKIHIYFYKTVQYLYEVSHRARCFSFSLRGRVSITHVNMGEIKRLLASLYQQRGLKAKFEIN